MLSPSLMPTPPTDDEAFHFRRREGSIVCEDDLGLLTEEAVEDGLLLIYCHSPDRICWAKRSARTPTC